MDSSKWQSSAGREREVNEEGEGERERGRERQERRRGERNKSVRTKILFRTKTERFRVLHRRVKHYRK